MGLPTLPAYTRPMIHISSATQLTLLWPQLLNCGISPHSLLLSTLWQWGWETRECISLCFKVWSIAGFFFSKYTNTNAHTVYFKREGSIWLDKWVGVKKLLVFFLRFSRLILTTAYLLWVSLCTLLKVESQFYLWKEVDGGGALRMAVIIFAFF